MILRSICTAVAEHGKLVALWTKPEFRHFQGEVPGNSYR